MLNAANRAQTHQNQLNLHSRYKKSNSLVLKCLNNKHNKLHKYSFIILVIVIVILFVFIISSLYQYHYLKSHNSSLSSELTNLVNERRILLNLIQSKEEIINKYNLEQSNIISRKNEFETLEHTNKYLQTKLDDNSKHYYSIVRKSNILSSIEDASLLFKWLPYSEDYNHAQIKLGLLYRGSEDGERCLNFHSLCNYKKATLSLIQSIPYEVDGKNVSYVFGGFTKVSFDSEETRRIEDDGSTFVFCVNNKAKYNTDLFFNGIFTGYFIFLNYGNLCYVLFDWKKSPTGVFWNGRLFTSHHEDNLLFPYLEDFYQVQEIEIFQVKIEKAN